MPNAIAPTPTDLADASATDLLALYRSGAASPVEATRAVLARIERLNPVLNAFCRVFSQRSQFGRLPPRVLT